MKEFKDSQDRTWVLNLSLAAAQRIDACDFSELTDKKISILNMHEADCMQEMIADPSIMFACIWCCIEPQAKKDGITQEEFTEAIDGLVIETGREAWVEELTNFFPEIKTALLKIQDVQKKSTQKAQKRMDKLADKVATRLEKDLEETILKAEKEVEKSVTRG